jgi:hypothetical protein
MAVLGVLACDLAFMSASAPAGILHAPLCEVVIADPCSFNGAANPAGPLVIPLGIGVNQTTHQVYVGDYLAHLVDRFSSVGTWESSFAVPAGPIYQLAVGAGGDIYVVSYGSGEIYKFSPSGEPLTPTIEGLAGPLGVAVDSEENVYVSLSSGEVEKFDSSGTAVPFTVPIVAPANSTGLAVNSHGDIYVASTSGTIEYAPSGEEIKILEAAPSTAYGVTVDSADNVFVDHVGVVAEYSESGAPIGNSFGSFAESYGVAVDNSSGNVYASDAAGGLAYIFAQIVVPTVVTGAASGVGLTSAKVEGTVNPEGLSVENCFFEYEETSATPGSGVKVPCEPAGGESFSGKLEGLSPGTAYKYNLFVETEGRLTSGSEANHEPTFTTKLAPPAVTNSPVLSVTRTTVSLSGEINPGNRETHYYIEYGENEAHGANGSPTNPMKLEGVDVSPHKIAPQTLEELHAGTTYHYRIVATSEGGTTLGPEGTFTTGPKQPASVETESGQATSQTTATLSATVNPNGLPANYSLEVATELNAGIPVYIPQSFGQVGESAETLTLTLTNLLPGTTYYWRVVVHNPEGSAEGASATFATPSFPNPISEPLHPLLVPVPPEVEEKPQPVKEETRAQKLTKALHQCTRQPKKKRAACRRKAERKYGPIKKKR